VSTLSCALTRAFLRSHAIRRQVAGVASALVAWRAPLDLPALVEDVPARANDPAAARTLDHAVSAPRSGGYTDSHESPRSVGYTESGYWSESMLVPQLAAADDAPAGAAAIASATDQA
jgi:hypothetical protein